MVRRIEEKAKSFDTSHINYVLREANQIADSLAKFGLSLETICRFFNYVPAFSSNSLIGDAHHVTFLRGF